jgi:uncharacterized membrane protein YoaK (UPF0700 family)
MISKLPVWMWVGAWVLASIAGMANVVGLLGIQHEAVSHMTGTVSRLGVSMADGDGRMVLHLLAVIGSFVAGASISSLLIRDRVLKPGRRYGLVLLLESVLFCVSVPMLNAHMITGACLASCACGLQNAMASLYSGAILRTTHMTGILTDIGIVIGSLFYQKEKDWLKLMLFGVILSGFITGCMISTRVFPYLQYEALLIPALIAGLCGGSYFLIRTRFKYLMSATQPAGHQ